jgi:glycopeptide antibiotics resistance protein
MERTTKRTDPGRLVAVVLFTIYLGVVTRYAILPVRFDSEYRHAVMEAGSPWSHVNIVPFQAARDDGEFIGRETIGNLLLGMPFGFGLPFVARLRLSRVLILGIVLGFGLELIQFLLNALGVAFPVRSVDINDVILNAAGTALGVGLFVLTSRLYGAAFRSRRPDWRVWRHFHDVLVGAGS